MNAADESFYVKLKGLCDDAGIDLITLGHRLGYDFNAITDLRRGRTVTLQTLVDIANYFHVTTDSLCSEVREPKPAAANEISVMLAEFVTFLQFHADDVQQSANYAKDTFEKTQKKADAAKKQADNAVKLQDYFNAYIHTESQTENISAQGSYVKPAAK